MPGGRVQKGHSVLETLEREIAEETGVTSFKRATPIGMVLSTIRIPLGNNESAGLILDIYECSIAASATITLSDEHIAYDWFPPAEAAALLAVKYPADFCEIVRNYSL